MLSNEINIIISKNWNTQRFLLLKSLGRSSGCRNNEIGSFSNFLACQPYFWNCLINRGYIQRCPTPFIFLPSSNKCGNISKEQCENEVNVDNLNSINKALFMNSHNFKKLQPTICKKNKTLYAPKLICSKFLICIGETNIHSNCCIIQNNFKCVCKWVETDAISVIEIQKSTIRCGNITRETLNLLDNTFYRTEVIHFIGSYKNSEFLNTSQYVSDKSYPLYEVLFQKIKKTKAKLILFNLLNCNDSNLIKQKELNRSVNILESYKKKMHIKKYRFLPKSAELYIDKEAMVTVKSTTILNDSFKLLLRPYFKQATESYFNMNEPNIKENLIWMNDSIFHGDEKFALNIVNNTLNFNNRSSAFSSESYLQKNNITLAKDVLTIHPMSKNFLMEKLVDNTARLCDNCSLCDNYGNCLLTSKVNVQLQ